MARFLTCFVLAVFSAGCSAIARLSANAVLESQSVADGGPLAKFAVTIHVILQEHENPNPEGRAKQNLERVAACQANVVELASKIAAAGAKAVVVEGLYAAGSFTQPEPIAIDEIAESERTKAKWLLAQRSDVTIYGFELKALNDFGIAVIGDVGKSIAQVAAAADEPKTALDAAERQRSERLILEEFTRLNLWYAGIIPERSFLALQTALAVALARGESQVQLVIGKQHWSDLAYAANRHPDVRLRLIPYSCD